MVYFISHSTENAARRGSFVFAEKRGMRGSPSTLSRVDNSKSHIGVRAENNRYVTDLAWRGAR